MNGRTHPELTKTQSEALMIPPDSKKQKIEVGQMLSPAQARRQLAQLQKLIKSVMQEGEHYGIIPGTEKPTLFLAGAQLLIKVHNYSTSIDIIHRTEQWDVGVTETTFPLFRYVVKVQVYDADGKLVSEGIGEANSYEQKYRFRQGSLTCPACGAKAIVKGKAEFGGGWLCYRKLSGCGLKFEESDTRITGQKVGQVHNEHIYDQINTILKMAKKRAYVDAAMAATRTAGIFTQDLEDFDPAVIQGKTHVPDARIVEETHSEKKTTSKPTKIKQTNSKNVVVASQEYLNKHNTPEDIHTLILRAGEKLKSKEMKSDEYDKIIELCIDAFEKYLTTQKLDIFDLEILKREHEDIGHNLPTIFLSKVNKLLDTLIASQLSQPEE